VAEIKTEKLRVGSGDLTSTPYSTLSSGTAAPNNANGTDGDIYIRIAGSNSDIYVKRSGSWLSIVTSFANIQLSNLTSPTNINQSLLFDISEVFDIGALGVNRPNNIYAKTSINLNSLSTNTLLQSDGSKNVTSLANGTNGQIMTMASGLPSWQNAPASAVPTGAVITYAGSSAPTGWLLCNGNTVPNGIGTVQGVTADFSALYAVVGSTYGSAGKLPDCGGVFVRGAGSQTIGAETYTATLGAPQNDATAVNGLTVTAVGDHAHNTTNSGTAGGAYTNPALRLTWTSDSSFINTYTTSANGAHTHALTGDTETRPANIALNYIIKY
jgi:microcystin-dependent protein